MRLKEKLTNVEWELSREEENGILTLAFFCTLIIGAVIMVLAPVSVRHAICIGASVVLGLAFILLSLFVWGGSIVIVLHRYWTREDDA